ncbi:MAG: NAD(P)-dependent glycerol-3-phosphate dehydrogenase [Deltaproteobacteria bacterium]|nr:NAD(P)-dependent glycerol-3-phosphate dehydrogenase [Deltaproteobacteria bacterium]
MGVIGVIGAGSWGTTLADLLAKKGHDVVLWAYEADLVKEMETTRVNATFLPGITLSPRLRFTNSLQEAVSGKELVLFVSPTQVVRGVVKGALPFLAEHTLLVNAAKGVELGTLMTISQICAELLPPELFANFSVLSGPSFAREVALEMPTAVVAASPVIEVARRVQEAFSTPCFRVYTNSDMVGVELGGSIKNVIAIAAGISDGLGLGYNPRAALITRGLAEMARLGLAMGAQSSTFAGLAGMGDLVLTCTGDLSRNRTVGMQLGEGKKLVEILGGMRAVAEGVKTAESAYRLAQRLGVDMPITEQVYRVLYEDKPPRQAVLDLMTRDLKAEGMEFGKIG